MIIFMKPKTDISTQKKNVKTAALLVTKLKPALIKKDAKYVYANLIILKNVHINIYA